jgi:two-component system response regulator
MKTILQVEDDPNDVFFLNHAMKKMGVANPVQVVTDGQEAIDYLQGAGKFADRGKFPFPCLVLLDLKLPYVMGLDVLKWIRQQPGMALVVVLLTASADEKDIATAYQLGANGYLVKPAEANKLQNIVEAIRDFWLTHNMLPQNSLAKSLPDGTAGRVRSPATIFARTPVLPVNGTTPREDRPRVIQTHL